METNTLRVRSAVPDSRIDVVEFTIDTVSHATLTYTSGDNHDPDGDSDGTVMMLASSDNRESTENRPFTRAVLVRGITASLTALSSGSLLIE